MDLQKILDELYTARWAIRAGKREACEEAITKAIAAALGHPEEDETKDPKDPETPSPVEPLKATLVLIVGHERKAPGADFALGGSEYNYNSEVAELARAYAARQYPNIALHVIYRDGIGISGANAKAAKLKPDACIELHFNAFNGSASGSETLTSVDAEDRRLAALVQAKLCDVFGRVGQSRGVKTVSRSARGGGNVYGLPASANCLVEPFFGDNKAEAQMAAERKTLYAHGLVDVMVDWCKSVGLS